MGMENNLGGIIRVLSTTPGGRLASSSNFTMAPLVSTIVGNLANEPRFGEGRCRAYISPRVGCRDGEPP